MTRDDVVRAACQIMDRSGAKSLTVAAVAEQVGFTKMAMYRHVDGRDDLIEAAVELVLRPVWQHEKTEDSWMDAVVTWMHDVRACLQAHPWAATMLGSTKGSAPPLQRAVDVLVGHLVRSPLDARDLARATAWTCRVTIGILVEELAVPVAVSMPSAMRMAEAYEGSEHDLIDDDVLFADVVAQTREFLDALAHGAAAPTAPR